MPGIDDYKNVLSSEMRAIWPLVAATASRLKGCLIGGTALALHLRHRRSFDLNIASGKSFSGRRLLRRLQRTCDDAGFSCDERFWEHDAMFATVNGVELDVVFNPASSAAPSPVTQLHPSDVVDGMPVASLPDLLAMKLDVIMYRPKLRDYIDIAAIDNSGTFRIEDGLRFHTQRYGIEQGSRIPDRILSLLKSPGTLSADRVFGDIGEETLRYLEARAVDIETHQAVWYVDGGTAAVPGEPASMFQPSLKRRPDPCGAWMPRARAGCRLPKGHRGHHRS